MLTKTRVLYRKLRVTVEIDKKGYCLACATSGRTEFHHYEYVYKTSEIKKDPQLATENTLELCYTCHRIADSLRKLVVDYLRFISVQNALIKKRGGDHVTIQS